MGTKEAAAGVVAPTAGCAGKLVSAVSMDPEADPLLTPAALDPSLRALAGFPPASPYGRAELSLTEFPAELMARPQWVCVRLDPPRKRGGKLVKVPINPRSGSPADSTKPSTWGAFEQARECFEKLPGIVGLGFVFHEADPYVFIDLDGCRDPETGAVEPWAAEILHDFADTYREVSAGLTGFHILVRGSLDGLHRKRRGKVEMYDRERYVWLTGYAL